MIRSALLASLAFALLLAPPAAAQEGGRRKVKVATKPIEPFVIEGTDGYRGFSIDLWREIARVLGLETELVPKVKVSELLDALKSKEVEVAMAGISITAEREKEVDFSHSFFESGLQVMVAARPGGAGLTDVIAAVFPDLAKAVGIVIVSLVVAAHLLWLFERRKNSQMFPATYVKGVWEAFWWAGVTVTTVGYGDKSPVGVGGRIVALVWMFSGILLISYFAATVTTAMTVQSLEGSIHGPEDLPGKRVATLTKTTAEAWLEGRRIVPRTFARIEDACAAVANGHVDAVVYDSPVLVWYARGEGAGKVRLVGHVFARQNYGIGLQPGSDLREPVNRALLDLRDSGTYDDLYRKWFGSDE